MTELVKLRTQLKTEFSLTYTDLIIKAVAKALKQHPRLNATLSGDEIRLLSEIHVGMAVAMDEGLLVAVVRNADQKACRKLPMDTQGWPPGRDGSLGWTKSPVGTFTWTIWALTAPISSPPSLICRRYYLGVGRIMKTGHF